MSGLTHREDIDKRSLVAHGLGVAGVGVGCRLVRAGVTGRRIKFKTGLPGNQFRTNVASMSTMSVSELKKKPTKQWLKSAGKDDLVITSKGQPIAVLLRIASASVESTRALVRSVRALQAQTALQQTAVVNGTSGFSMSDIDAEIAASRRTRRRK